MTTIPQPEIEIISDQRSLFNELVRDVCKAAATRIRLPYRTYQHQSYDTTYTYRTLSTNKDLAELLRAVGAGRSSTTSYHQDNDARDHALLIGQDAATDANMAHALHILFKAQECDQWESNAVEEVRVASSDGAIQRDQNSDKLNMDKLSDMLSSAGSKLKQPKITFNTSEYARQQGLRENLQFKKQTKGRNAGKIAMTDGGRYGSNTFYGYIEEDGKVELYYQGRENKEWLMPFLHKFAEDPSGLAAAFGKESGSCCYCRKELTDPRSVRAGFGERCAKNYGLLEQYRNA